jgi:hypothetical protein
MNMVKGEVVKGEGGKREERRVKSEGAITMLRFRLELIWRQLPRLRRECRVATGVIGLW